MPTLKELVVTITSDVSGLLAGTKTATEVLTKFGTTVNVAMTKLEKLSDVSKAVGGVMTKAGTAMTVGITAPLLAAGAAAVKSAASMEMLNAEFTTLLGDGNKAKRMLEDLADAAARTPFGLEDLAQASKTMLAFGLAAEDILPNLQMLGDVAGGNADKLKSLTLAFSQIQSTGRLMGQDLLQLINAGFNPLQTISEKTGETMAELKTRMEQGGISAVEVSEAFKVATSEGGLFYGGMERASQTFLGRLSTLKDNIAALGRQFGEILLPILSDIMDEVSTMVEVFSSFDDGTKKVIITIAAMAAAIGPLLFGFGKMLIMIPELVSAVKLLTGPQALGALVSGGPIILGIAAAVGIIAAITVNTIKARQEQTRYNQAIAGQLSMQETQVALDEKRKRIAEELQNIAVLERNANRQGVAQAIAAARQRVEAMQGEAAQLSNVISGYQRQVAEETRLAPIREEEARKAEELARIERERAEAIEAYRLSQEKFTSTLRNIDALVTAGAIKEVDALEQKIQLRKDEIEAIKKAAIEGKITATAATSQINEQQRAIENYESRHRQLTANMEETTYRYYDSANQHQQWWTSKVEESNEKIESSNTKTWETAVQAVEFFGDNIKKILSVANEDWQDMVRMWADGLGDLLIQTKDSTAVIVGTVVKVVSAAWDGIETLFEQIKDAESALSDSLDNVFLKTLNQKLSNEKDSLQITIDRINAEEISEEEKNKKIEKAKEASAKVQKKLLHDIAIAERDIALAQAKINMQKALSELPFWASKAQKNEVKSLYGDLIAAISGTPIPAYARGTDFAPGGAAIVGERGPEIVNLPAGSQVIPAHRTMSGSGSGVTVNIYSPVAVNPSEAAAIMKQTGREMAFMGVM